MDERDKDYRKRIDELEKRRKQIQKQEYRKIVKINFVIAAIVGLVMYFWIT